MKHVDFLKYIEEEFKKYVSLQGENEKREQKAFINGLMTASKFFGVTYDELQSIVNKYMLNQSSVNDSNDYLDIPTFLRVNKK